MTAPIRPQPVRKPDEAILDVVRALARIAAREDHAAEMARIEADTIEQNAGGKHG